MPQRLQARVADRMPRCHNWFWTRFQIRQTSQVGYEIRAGWSKLGLSEFFLVQWYIARLQDIRERSWLHLRGGNLEKSSSPIPRCWDPIGKDDDAHVEILKCGYFFDWIT